MGARSTASSASSSAGKVNRFIPNPTFDPISKPGALDEYFRGRNPKGEGVRELFGDLDPLSEHPEYRDRDARLELMDEQGMRGAIFLPTLGVGMEQALLDDPPALLAAFRAFNRWLDEDWGFAYQERIFGAPMLTLVDPDEALKSVQWALDHDARFFVLVPGPGHHAGRARCRRPTRCSTRCGACSTKPGAVVAAHGGNAYYSRYLADWGEGDRDGGVPPEPVPFASCRGARCRTGSPTSSPTASSTASRTCAWRRSRPAPTGCSTSSTS